MINLMKSDLLKLKKDVPFRVIVIIMLVINFFSIGMFKIIALMAGGDIPTDVGGELSQMALLSTIGISSLGLFVAVMCAMFAGKDFGQNTIRNKIISGNSRFKIFANAFVSNLIIGLSLFIITVIEGLLLNLMFYGAIVNFSLTMQAIVLCVPLYIAFIAVVTLISFATRSQMLGIVFNVLVMVVLPGVLSIVSVAVSAFGGNQVLETILSVFPYQLINDLTGGSIMGSLNPAFIDGALSGVFVAKTLISSLVLAALALTGGYLTFKNADVK